MYGIGSRIKSRRQELGMTQQELATKLGYKSRSTINKVEEGINDLTQTAVVKYAKVLNTTPAYLMGWEEEESVQLYRALSFENKEAVDAMIRRLAKYQKEMRGMLNDSRSDK